MSNASPQVEEVVRDGESYTLAEFKNRVRMKRTAYLSARRNGLQTIKVHGRTYVRGEDWLRYLAEQVDPNMN